MTGVGHSETSALEELLRAIVAARKAGQIGGYTQYGQELLDHLAREIESRGRS